MSIKALAAKLESLETEAGEEGWGGEFREEMFDEMIRWLQEPRERSSLGLLLAHLLSSDTAKTAAYQKESGLCV